MRMLRRTYTSLCVSTCLDSASYPADLWCKSEEDTIYEQDILRDPDSIKPWLAYIEIKLRHGSLHDKAFVRLRALLACSS